MNEKLEQKLREAATNGKISCSMARRIAAELDVPVRQVGDVANKLKIKITSCELGCF